jgi:hypothetical protein
MEVGLAMQGEDVVRKVWADPGKAQREQIEIADADYSPIERR